MVTGDIVAEDLINASSSVVQEVGKVGLWLKGVGVIVILWLVFNSVNLWLNRRKWKKIEKYDEDIKRLEKKVEKSNENIKRLEKKMENYEDDVKRLEKKIDYLIKLKK